MCVMFTSAGPRLNDGNVSTFVMRGSAPNLMFKGSRRGVNLRNSEALRLAFRSVHIPSRGLLNGRKRNFGVTVTGLSTKQVNVTSRTLKVTRTTFRTTTDCTGRHMRFNGPVTTRRNIKFGLTSVTADIRTTGLLVCHTTSVHRHNVGYKLRTSVTGLFTSGATMSISARTVRMFNNCNCARSCPIRHCFHSTGVARVCRNADRVRQVIVDGRLWEGEPVVGSPCVGRSVWDRKGAVGFRLDRRRRVVEGVIHSFTEGRITPATTRHSRRRHFSERVFSGVTRLNLAKVP